MTNQEANKEILWSLIEWVNAYPDMSFMEILYRLDITEAEVREKSKDTLEIMKRGGLIRGET